MKSNLEDLYLNIKQCILILLKNYTIWSHNLVLLLLKKRTLFSKIPAVSAHESKSSAAVPNFGRGFKFHRPWGLHALSKRTINRRHNVFFFKLQLLQITYILYHCKYSNFKLFFTTLKNHLLLRNSVVNGVVHYYKFSHQKVDTFLHKSSEELSKFSES